MGFALVELCALSMYAHSNFRFCFVDFFFRRFFSLFMKYFTIYCIFARENGFNDIKVPPSSSVQLGSTRLGKDWLAKEKRTKWKEFSNSVEYVLGHPTFIELFYFGCDCVSSSKST